MKRLPIILALSILLVSILIVTHNQTALAANGANWQAGRIIDDAVFTDANAMSASQIQDFLNQKVGTGGNGRVAGQCDTNGVATSELGGGTRAQYGAAHNNPAPFTCLKDYYEVPKTDPSPGVPASNYGGAPIPAGARSAAQLIWDASQRYNISPKVLLVTIQKESVGPLTTDDWPFKSQYTYAMGAHCPDSGPGGAANCDQNYAGFSIQISESAALFRYYLDNMSQPWWPYKKLGNNDILYQNARPDCGSSTVNIISRATAALYTYTPYQPNQAALDNLYGLGDGCSAYGNRNFWRIFTDWFGTIYANGYEAHFYSQSPYPTIANGASKTVNIQYTNLGFARWYDDVSVPTNGQPLHLAATDPINRTSTFSATWPSAGRAGQTFTKVYESDGKTLANNQHAVEPGQIASFDFQLTVPTTLATGVYRESFQPVLEGAAQWAMGGQSWLDVTVESPYKATVQSQGSSPSLKSNDTATTFIQYKNTGEAYWYDDATASQNNALPIRLAATYPINRSSIFSASWPSSGRASHLFTIVYEADGVTPSQIQHLVKPGQIARFEFNLTARTIQQPGIYREYFQPIKEGPGNFIMGGLTSLDVGVSQTTNKASFYNQSAYPTIKPGESFPSYLAYRNNGTTNWYDDTSATAGVSPVHLAATNQINRSSIFSYGWPSAGRPDQVFTKVYETNGSTLAANQHVVAPGQIARFEFNLTAPWTATPGFTREFFQPVIEGPGNWNMDGFSWLDISLIPR